MKTSSLLRIIKNWKNPYFARNAILYKLISFIYRKNNGFFLFSEKWDNLIILDACRYDTFEEQFKKNDMEGNLDKKISRGCHTISFLLENFKKSKYEDIVYITANPHVDLLIKDKFFKVISVWKDGWSEKEHTVLPETIYEYTLDAIAKFPEKKKIIHFMQPHFPYIGFKLKEDSSEIFRNAVIKGKDVKLKKNYSDKLFSWFSLDLYAMIKRKDHFKLYKKNLEIVLPYVSKLIDILKGRTVVTADHGEAIGEFLHFLIPIRFYGHKEKMRLPILTQVPWLIIDSKGLDKKEKDVVEERKKIIKSVKSISKSLSKEL